MTPNKIKMAYTESTTLRIWDLPTRLFHWALAICVTGSFVTIKMGGFVGMEWHVRFGQITFGLILFRLIWGFVGPHYARFRQFVHGPLTIWRYLRGEHLHIAGHNPVGAVSVVAMLFLFGFQAFSGLFASEDVFFTSGPLAHLSRAWSTRLTGLHKLAEWPLLALIALHLGAIVWHQFVNKQQLARAMVTGDIARSGADAHLVPQTRDNLSVRVGAALLAGAIAALTWWITTLAPSATSFY